MNIKTLTIKQAKNIITEHLLTLRKMIESGVDPEIIKSFNTCFYLVSSPGLGKTSITEQIIRELNSVSKKPEYEYHIIHPSQRDPADIMGVPFPNTDRSGTVHLRPEDMFPAEKSKVKFGIYCIDEFSSCHPDLQACMYSLLLNGEMDNLKLPLGWVRVATGNKITDNAVVYNISSAAINRMTVFEIVPDLESFKEYIYNKYPNSNGAATVAAYLTKNPDAFYSNLDNWDGSPFATPRKWEKIIIVLDNINGSKESIIAGDIGVSQALHFIEFIKIMHEMPDIKELLSRPKEILPKIKNKNVYTALITMIPQHLVTNPKDLDLLMKEDGILFHLPKEIDTMILKELKLRMFDKLTNPKYSKNIEALQKKFPEIFEA